MARVSLYTVIFLLTLCSFAECSKLSSSQELQLLYGIFKDWIIKFNKQYGIEEIAIRFLNWKSNYLAVQDQNAKDDSCKLEMNSFADMDSEEFSALHLGLNVDLDAARKRHHNKKHHDEAPKAQNATGNATNSTHNASNATNATNATNSTNSSNSTQEKLPASVDWRKEGAVTSVKNQGQCGGCWSFSAAGALEGLHAIKNKDLVNLSVQQMIDCSAQYGNMGCDGGLMTNAYSYTQNYGIQLADAYEYTASVGECNLNEKKVIFKNSGFTEVSANNASALKAAVAKQPVSVGIEASSLTFQLYKSGVVTKGCSTNLDHAVLIVGYDVDKKGQEYWIVKNSWGAEWGVGGYFHLAMGDQNDGAGVCGVNMMASYPTIEKDQQ